MSGDQIQVLIRFRCRKRIELSYLPASDTEKEAQDIGLLLLLKLFNVFEGALRIETLAFIFVQERAFEIEGALKRALADGRRQSISSCRRYPD